MNVGESRKEREKGALKKKANSKSEERKQRKAKHADEKRLVATLSLILFGSYHGMGGGIDSCNAFNKDDGHDENTGGRSGFTGIQRAASSSRCK